MDFMFGGPRLGALSRITEDGDYLSPNICFATEGPTFHDGGQCQASTALTNYQFYAVTMTTVDRLVTFVTVSSQGMYGVLQNRPTSGQSADIVINGITKAAVGAGGWTPGMTLQPSTQADFVAYSSGTKAGMSLVTASSGALGTMFVLPVFSSGLG